jgi:hypothetical protein
MAEPRTSFDGAGSPARSRAFVKTLQAAWNAARWPAFATLVVVAGSLGWIGIADSMSAAGQHPSRTDLLYRVVQLFLFGGGDVVPPIPWQLDVARFLAPALAAYATLSAVATLLGERLSAVRAGWYSGHVVVCGLGSLGVATATELRNANDRVVAIERDPLNPGIAECRERGVIVLVGDVADIKTLRRARVHRAAFLFAVTGDDATNADVARVARTMTSDAGKHVSQSLTCFVHLHDQTLGRVLRQFAITEGNRDRFRLESFSLDERAASALLDAHMPFDATDQTQGPPHVLVVGAGNITDEVIVETARRWRRDHAVDGSRIAMTVVADDADAQMAALGERYPQLSAACEITPLAFSLDSAAFVRAGFLRNEAGAQSVTSIFVCAGDDARGISAGIHLRYRLGREDVPIVVVTQTRQNGVASLLEAEFESGIYGNVRVFGLLDCLGDRDVLLRSNIETVAIALNADYCRQDAESKGSRENRTAAAMWADCSLGNRDSSRSAAADLGRKLHAIQCDLEPLTDWAEEPIQLTAAEIDRLARVEHERWLGWQADNHWHYGPTKNPDLREHPDMVPFDELSADAQEKCRDQVRRVPRFLKTLDFRVVRRVPPLSLEAQVERLAQVIHEGYLRHQAEDGQDVGATAAAVPWTSLPEAFKESNRHHAADIARKLGQIGCAIRPIGATSEPLFAFEPVELESLAKVEHDRWWEERVAQGWTLGPARDDAAKRSPYLVPYSELPEESKEYDRTPVREIPAMLAEAGFKVTRIGSAPPGR